MPKVARKVRVVKPAPDVRALIGLADEKKPIELVYDGARGQKFCVVTIELPYVIVRSGDVGKRRRVVKKRRIVELYASQVWAVSEARRWIAKGYRLDR